MAHSRFGRSEFYESRSRIGVDDSLKVGFGFGVEFTSRAFLQRRSRSLCRRYNVAVDLYFWLRGSSASPADAADARDVDRPVPIFRTNDL
jgi:hypothetical protein